MRVPDGSPPAPGLAAWRVVVGGFAVHAVAFGLMYSFGVFFEALANDLGVGLDAVAWVAGVAGGSLVLFSAPAGWLAARVGARATVVAGSIITMIAVVAGAASTTVVHAVLTLGLLLGVAGSLSYAPVHGAVAQWFDSRRGLALGIVLAGSGAGAAVIAPAAAWAVDRFGWRHALVLVGIAGFLIHAAGALLVVDRGQLQTPERPSFRVVQDRWFRVVYVGTFAGSFAYLVPFVYLVPYGQKLGLTLASAGILLALLSLGNTAGRIAFGLLADRAGALRPLCGATGGCVLSLATWPHARSATALTVVAVVFGVCSGGWLALLPSLVADRYGAPQLSAVAGLLYTSMLVGTVLGPPVTGALVESFSSYVWPMALATAAMAVNLGMLLLLQLSGRALARPSINGGTL